MAGAGDPFIIRIEAEAAGGHGRRVAVKDLIDVAGLPTTAGCRAVAERAAPAARDADCVSRVRAGGGRVVGKTALHELAFGVTGENPWYGTPVNPLDPSRVPGGSSSGSAVAVAVGAADFAIGSDTGGSIRIPAACCGVVGLKTTSGSLPLDGVRPLAPSFDTIGPMGATVAATALGYELLAGRGAAGGGGAGAAGAGAGGAVDGRGGSAPGAGGVGRAGRLRGIDGVDADIDDAVDAALERAGIAGADCDLGGAAGDGAWEPAFRAHRVILAAEAHAANGYLLAGDLREGVGDEVRGKLERGAALGEGEVEAAWKTGRAFRSRLLALLEEVGVLALPAIPCPPPALGAPWDRLVWLTAPINLAGLPALAVPVPLPGSVWSGGRASLQLVGPPGSEWELLGLGARVEAGAGA